MQITPNPIIKFIANIRDYGLEYVSRRYYSLYGGEVVQHGRVEGGAAPETGEDKQAQGRVTVKVGVLGIGTTNTSGAFDPKPISRPALPGSIYAGLDHGIYFPPEVGDSVWVSFDHGDPQYPRTHGSWWRNSDPNKDPSKSEVPAEFRLDNNGAPVMGPPTRRGIKTKYGHGVVFSDEESAPYVALWSGQQTGVNEKAVVKQQITLSDATGVKTTNDETVNTGIYAHTTEGLRVKLDDTQKKVTVSGKPDDPGELSANSFTIEEMPGQSKITIKTKGVEGARHQIVVDDILGTISVMSKGQQSIVINDLTGLMTVTATGALLLSAAGGIAMGSGAAPPAPAIPGASVETGVGTKIINFVGAVTETLGAFTQTAATVVVNAATSFTVTSPTISLGSPVFGISILGGLITIGNPIIAGRVLDEALLDWLANHTHDGNLGAPTPVTSTFIMGTPASLKDPTNPSQPNPIYITNTKIS